MQEMNPGDLSSVDSGRESGLNDAASTARPSSESASGVFHGGADHSLYLSSSSSSSGSSSMDHSSQGPLLGYDYEFVPAVDSKYVCPICMLVLRSPVQTECGHRFCSGCIKRWLTQSAGDSECPNCKDKLTSNQIFPDNFAKREIMNLSLRCPNAKNGCEVLLDLHHIQSHLDTLCEYALCPCPNNCSNILFKKDLHHHVTITCPKLWTTCTMCHEKICSVNYESHLLTCQMSMELCTHCGKKFLKSKIKSHQDVDCLLVTVSCMFLPFGCQHKCSREQLQNHVETSLSDHLQLVSKGVLMLLQHLNASPFSLSAKGHDVQQSGVFYLSRYSQVDAGHPQGTATNLESKAVNRDLCDLITSDLGFESFCPTALHSSTVPSSSSSHLAPEQVERSYTSPDPLSSEVTGSSYDSRSSSDEAKCTATIHQELKQNLSQLQQRFAQYTERLSSIDSLREEIVARQCNGCFLWRIDNVERHRQAAKSGTATALHSRGFYTSVYGYKICIRVNLNGIETGCNKHIALFIHFMRGDYDDLLDWPFHGTITLSILDQNKPQDGVRANYTESLEANPALAAFARPSASRNHKGFGYIEFAPLTILDNPIYVKNSVLFIRATVRVSDSMIPSSR